MFTIFFVKLLIIFVTSSTIHNVWQCPKYASINQSVRMSQRAYSKPCQISMMECYAKTVHFCLSRYYFFKTIHVRCFTDGDTQSLGSHKRAIFGPPSFLVCTCLILITPPSCERSFHSATTTTHPLPKQHLNPIILLIHKHLL